MTGVHSRGELEKMADDVFGEIQSKHSRGEPLLLKSEISSLYTRRTNEIWFIVESMIHLMEKYGKELRSMGYELD